MLARSKDNLGRTLDSLPAALKVLNDNRSNIVDAFGALQKFAAIGSRVLSETKADFTADMKDLFPPVIKRSTTTPTISSRIWNSCRPSRSTTSICVTRSAVTT